MKLYDITRPLGPETAGWPGDTPTRLHLAWSRAAGAGVNVGALTTSLHTGTHVDAPFHFQDGGLPIDRLALEPFLGPAVVVDVTGRDPVTPADIPAERLRHAPRVLLRTGGWPDSRVFPSRLPVLDPALPTYLAASGVVLLGVDLPSVDPLDCRELPVHHGLEAAGIRILEGLDLATVPPGRYELIALPLLLPGMDGAPVRAILRSLTLPPEG